MRILIVNPFGIGDVLFSLPLAGAIRQAHPKGTLAYLCNRRTEPLVRLWPMLDEVFVFEKDEFRQQWKRSRRGALGQMRQLLRSIRSRRFDALVDLSLGWPVGLGGWLAGIPQRIGFNYRGRGRFLTQKTLLTGFDRKAVSDYYLDLLTPLGLERPLKPLFELTPPAQALEEVQHLLGARGAGPNPRWIGMVPGGGTSWGPNAQFKRWEPERFSEVAEHLIEKFSCSVMILGDTQERELCRTLGRNLPQDRVALPDSHSLAVLAALLARCELVVGNDSGPMHLARAVGAKTLTIFGPVDPYVYGPPPQTDLHRVVLKALPCRPCYQRFRLPPCPWDHRCLKGLEVEPVKRAAEELLA